MKKGFWRKALTILGWTGLIGCLATATFSWFTATNVASPSNSNNVASNGMHTDAFVYQRSNHTYDDDANKEATLDSSGTLTFDHSQGQSATGYYIMGKGSRWAGDFASASGLQMYTNPNNPNDHGVYWKIALEENDEFKIYDSAGARDDSNYWYGYSSIASSCTLKGTNFVDHSTNIQVAVAGVYDIFVNIQNVITIQYHSDTRFSADTTNEIGYLIVGSGSNWTGDYQMGSGISMTINRRSDYGIDKAMYAGLRIAKGDSFRVVDGSSSQDSPIYYPTDDTSSNLAPRTSGAAATSYFSYSATDSNYTFTCRRTAYYCVYLNSSSCVNIQLWDGKATDGSTYYTRGVETLSDQSSSFDSPRIGARSGDPKRLSSSSASETIYFKDATWWGGNNADSYGTRIYMWNSSSTRRIYVNTSNCSWYHNDSCVPYFYPCSSNWARGTQAATNIYYADVDVSSDKVYVARSTGGGRYNEVNATLVAKDYYYVNSDCTGLNASANSYSVDYSAENGAFPGPTMTRLSPATQSTTVSNYYSYTYNAKQYDKVIFSRWSSTYARTDAQTNDITLSSSGSYNMYDISGTSATWLDSKVTGSWGTYSAPAGISLTFTATYGSDTDVTNVVIPYGGSNTAPAFSNHYGYTSPSNWGNGTNTISPGATITYATASGYASNAFTATYSASGNSTYYLDLYNLKYATTAGFSNSPTFKIYAWEGNGAGQNHDYGAYGASGFPATPITTGVINNVSGQTGYDANANYDYRYCFWSVTLPSSVIGYIVYVGNSITDNTWQSGDIAVSSNLAVINTDKTITLRSGCSGHVRTVTTKSYIDGNETTLYKYNVFDHGYWTVPTASSVTGHTFNKWYSNTSGSNGTEYTAETAYQITANTTLYCLYNVNNYNLSKVIRVFRNGAYKKQGSTTSQSLTYNTSTTVTQVTYAGATFVGWYRDAACTDLYSASAEPSYTIGAADATLYAKFNLNAVALRGTYKFYDASDALAKTEYENTTVYVEDSLNLNSGNVRNVTASATALTSRVANPYFQNGWYSNAAMTSSWSSQTVSQSNVAAGIDLYAKLSTVKVYLWGSSAALGNWKGGGAYTDSSYSQAYATTVTFSNVPLSKGDELKTYCHQASTAAKRYFPDSGTYGSVTGSAILNGFIDFNSSDEYNMRVQLAGTYTFAVSLNASHDVTAISVVATSLDASNFSVDYGVNGMSISPEFGVSAGNLVTTFHAYIGDTFRLKIDFYSSDDQYKTPAILDDESNQYDGLEIQGGYIRSDIDANITLVFSPNLTTFGSSSTTVTRVIEYEIVYAVGEHAEFDTATYFIQTADNDTFTSAVNNTPMHYPTDTTNYHAIYTGYTLSFSEGESNRYLRVLQRVSNESGSSEDDYQVVFDAGATLPTGKCTVNYTTDVYTFTVEGVYDIKVHKAVSDDPYLEITNSEATTAAATTHFADIYLIGRGMPGSDIRNGDYTIDHGERLYTYGGNTSNFPAYVGETDYTSSTYATAVAAGQVGAGIDLKAGDEFTLTDGVSTFGPASNGTGYTVSSGTVTITQSAKYYIWAASSSSVTVAQKAGSVISDGRTADDISIDSSEDWSYDPIAYTRNHGARVLNASGTALSFGGKLDYSLLDGCGDGYYRFYVELRNTSASSSGTVTYGFSGLSVPIGTKIKYANAAQNGGSTLKSGFNATTIAALSGETTLTTLTEIENTVVANANGFAGSTVIEVMIPISQIATNATFDFAFTISVSYQESFS